MAVSGVRLVQGCCGVGGYQSDPDLEFVLDSVTLDSKIEFRFGSGQVAIG